MKSAFVAFNAVEQEAYDAAFLEGGCDAYDDYASHDYVRGTAGWYGYRDGINAALRPVREEPEDTSCVQNCDDWGTGEGQFHGRM